MTSIDQEAELGVGDDEVRLALALDAVVADDPGDVRRERVLGREGGAQPVVDTWRSARVPRLSSGSRRSSPPAAISSAAGS